MRILLIGDIVGKPGRKIVCRCVNGLREKHKLDFIIANAENAAGGSGLTPANYHELIKAGLDCITLGDHAYKRRDIFSIMESEPRIVKPANYPDTAPGRPYVVLESRTGYRVAVFCIIGRVFMNPIDCPLQAADRVLKSLPADLQASVVDFHAEATSDMQVMGRYLDGRVSAVLGTHTHVATADEQILPGGTGFQCDVGMTGPHESIIGRRIDRVTEAVRHFRPTTFEVATEDVRIHGTIVDVDPLTRKATAIERLAVNEDEAAKLA